MSMHCCVTLSCKVYVHVCVLVFSALAVVLFKQRTSTITAFQIQCAVNKCPVCHWKNTLEFGRRYWQTVFGGTSACGMFHFASRYLTITTSHCPGKPDSTRREGGTICRRAERRDHGGMHSSSSHAPTPPLCVLFAISIVKWRSR
uniref:Uncharacterized protein n=1 Tax=Anopheles darlingi TaxID=43151 RepID=A0A2M4D5V5_ANODA